MTGLVKWWENRHPDDSQRKMNTSKRGQLNHPNIIIKNFELILYKFAAFSAGIKPIKNQQ